jgi:lipid-A-disaccharide synthase-like uncharacterized protein
MNTYALYSFGFLAQACFGARLIVQWVYAERAGKVVSPTLFWILSLLASFLFLIYGVLRDDVIILIGQTVSYYIYVRNLQLKGDWQRFPLPVKVIAFPLPILLLAWMSLSSTHSLSAIITKSDFTHILLIVGAVGQLLLNFRFIYQWYYSERAKNSILPLGFWIISMIASVMVISYAVYKQDPVLLVAQSMGIVVYFRNIIIALRKRHGLSVGFSGKGG